MLRARLADVKPSHWAIKGEATEAEEITEGWLTFETAVGRAAMAIFVSRAKNAGRC